ncbi:hypothetical protein [Pseudarthrobacter sp. S6]|uniref:hypothetical protein n=1 Tax=Pseudarthrobacter sp. S6 TaxID=3418420 RepID=UPI003CF4419E
MDHKQTIAMLTWINQVDPRVMLNEANVDVWAYAMTNTAPDVAKQAVLEHYKANESIAASPGAISKRAANIKNSREAKTNALEALPPIKHPNSWRSRNPAEWDRLFEEGQEQRRAELMARGLL